MLCPVELRTLRGEKSSPPIAGEGIGGYSGSVPVRFWPRDEATRGSADNSRVSVAVALSSISELLSLVADPWAGDPSVDSRPTRLSGTRPWDGFGAGRRRDCVLASLTALLGRPRHGAALRSKSPRPVSRDRSFLDSFRMDATSLGRYT